jgi:hypothetical protein
MSKQLNISDDLKLPLELAARTQCIFAQKGAGKTYAAGVMTEEMLGAGVQVVVLDPTGVWWGLQSSADGGKSPYEIIIMGGAHGDVPLEPDAGEIVATFLVETGQSVVLDVSMFESQAAQDRFALALATKLYRLKANDRANVHVFLDEADQFCPLRPQKGQERLLHSWDIICRLGRSRGLGFTAISQRPAVVHTNIRNNVDLLTCLRVTGVQDFKALREWTNINATAEQAKEFLEKVPTLPDGEAFFWSPSWLKIFERAKIRQKRTFDSSRTPKPGERAVVPKARREPDLSKLTEQIKASVQRAKANDPTELKKKLAAAEKALAERPAPAAALPAPKVIEKPVITDKQLDRLEKLQTGIVAAVAAWWKRAADQMNPLLEKLNTQRDEIVGLRNTIAAATAATVPAPGRYAPPTPVVHAPPAGRRSWMKDPPASRLGEANNWASDAHHTAGAPEHAAVAGLSKCASKQLAVLSQFSQGCTIGKLALLSGYRISGGFKNGLAELRTAGYITGDNTKVMQITAAGAALGPFPSLPRGRALIEYWSAHSSFGKAAKAILQSLLRNPQGFTIDRLAADTGYEISGGFKNALGDLRTAGVIQGKNTETMRPSDELLEALNG